MTTPSFSHPLNRLEVFRWLVAQEVARRGGSSDDQLTANAWTLGLWEASIPPAIGLAAQQHVDMILPRPADPIPVQSQAPPPEPRKWIKVRLVPAAVLETELRVLHLRETERLRFKDIARRLGWGADRVRTVYARGKRRAR